MRSGFAAALAAMLALAATAAAAATPPRYEVTAAVANAHGFDLNNDGTFVGRMATAGGGERGFIYDSAGLHVLGTSGGDRSAAYGINNLGQVTGVTYRPDGSYRAFVHDDGVLTELWNNPLDYNSIGYAINDLGMVTGMQIYTPLEGLGLEYGYAMTYNQDFVEGYDLVLGTTAGVAINNHGDVVGFGMYLMDVTTFDLHGHTRGLPMAHAYSEILQTSKDSPSPHIAYNLYGATFGVAWDINDKGWTVGATYASSFFYDGEVHPLGNFMHVPMGLNEAGQVVGRDRAGTDEGFLYDDGETWLMSELLGPDSGWEIYQARDINDHGQIVATGFDRFGVEHALLLSPVMNGVPEPGAWALMLLGFGLMGSAVRAQRRARA